MMEFHYDDRPNSSAVSHTFYIPDDQTMLVWFKSGRMYRYEGIPMALWAEFRAAESAGRFFNAHIRGQYPYREANYF